MRFKKLFISLSLVLVFLFTQLLAERVAESEIKKHTQDINFINYEGPNTRRDNPAAIRRIGSSLARLSRRQPGRMVTYGNKYSIIHSFDPKSPALLGADILVFNSNAQVDHIRNVRRIISAFLETRYQYSAAEANTLAFFITVYNAVYRKDLAYLSKNYQPGVLGYLSAENAGLDLNYKNWPGKSRVLIPLTNGSSDRALDTTKITDDKVIKKLQEQPDKGLDDRKKMVDIKEKEIKKEETKLTDIKKKLDEKEDKSEKETKKREDEILKKEAELKKTTDPVKKEELKKEIEQDKKELDTKKKDDSTQIEKERKDFEDLQKKVDEKKKEVEKDKKEIKKDETELKIEKDPQEFKKELEKKSQTLDEKEEEIKQREKDLKKGETDKNVFQGKLFYLKATQYLVGGHYNNEMLLINAATGKVEKPSSVKNICGKKYDVFEEGVAVIIHQGDHQSAHNLAILDRDTLEIKHQGRENIFWRSFVENKNNYIFAIIIDQGQTYLAKFNHQLRMEAKSTQNIDQDSFISFFGDFIYVNNSVKEIVMLKESDLSFVRKIEP